MFCLTCKPYNVVSPPAWKDFFCFLHHNNFQWWLCRSSAPGSRGSVSPTSEIAARWNFSVRPRFCAGYHTLVTKVGTCVSTRNWTSKNTYMHLSYIWSFWLTFGCLKKQTLHHLHLRCGNLYVADYYNYTSVINKTTVLLTKDKHCITLMHRYPTHFRLDMYIIM